MAVISKRGRSVVATTWPSGSLVGADLRLARIPALPSRTRTYSFRLESGSMFARPYESLAGLSSFSCLYQNAVTNPAIDRYDI